MHGSRSGRSRVLRLDGNKKILCVIVELGNSTPRIDGWLEKETALAAAIRICEFVLPGFCR